MQRRALLFGVSVFVLAAGLMLPKITGRFQRMELRHDGRQHAWKQRVEGSQKTQGGDSRASISADDPPSNSRAAEKPAPAAEEQPQLNQNGGRAAGRMEDYLLICGIIVLAAGLLFWLGYIALR